MTNDELIMAKAIWERRGSSDEWDDMTENEKEGWIHDAMWIKFIGGWFQNC